MSLLTRVRESLVSLRVAVAVNATIQSIRIRCLKRTAGNLFSLENKATLPESFLEDCDGENRSLVF